jgi:ATP-binding cassette subfamily C protein
MSLTLQLRCRCATVFAHVDHVMIMANGNVVQMGERAEVLKRINFNPAPQTMPSPSSE